MRVDKSSNAIRRYSGLIRGVVFLFLIVLSHNLLAEFELLKHEDPTVRSREALRMGNEDIKEAVPALIEALKDKVTGVRINAVVSLGKLKDDRAVEPLIDILNNDKVPAARVMAAEALGNFDSEKVKEEILKASDSTNEDVRYSAVLSLGKFGGDSEVDKLIEKAKNDQHWSVREAAVGALADIAERGMKGSDKRKEIEKAISQAEKDENKEVSRLAQKALKRLENVPGKKKKKWIFF